MVFSLENWVDSYFLPLWEKHKRWKNLWDIAMLCVILRAILGQTELILGALYSICFLFIIDSKNIKPQAKMTCNILEYVLRVVFSVGFLYFIDIFGMKKGLWLGWCFLGIQILFHDMRLRNTSRTAKFIRFFLDFLGMSVIFVIVKLLQLFFSYNLEPLYSGPYSFFIIYGVYFIAIKYYIYKKQSDSFNRLWRLVVTNFWIPFVFLDKIAP